MPWGSTLASRRGRLSDLNITALADAADTVHLTGFSGAAQLGLPSKATKS
jgi:hypothetical protein